MAVGGLIGLLGFGSVFVAFGTVANDQLGVDLTREDGLIEWLGALAFLLAAILQLVLYWRSEVPPSARLVRFARRNPFHLGLAVVLFIAFAEEISWGQRVFGWATPDDFVVENVQGETNLHNLAPFQGDSLLSMTRLFTVFWLAYCVILPLVATALAGVMALCERISLPIPPIWIGGLLLGAFVAWRTFNSLQSTTDIANGQELWEAVKGVCLVALGVAQIARIDLGATAGSEQSQRSIVRM
jgi:hypothetical protein